VSRLRPVATLVLIVAIATQVRGQSAVPRTIELPPPDATLAAEFTLVTSVRELSDGRLLIVDASEKKLLVANWSNGSATQLGRNGSGPEEYLQPSTLFALDGDSTLLPDSRNGRWLLLSGASIVTTIGPDAPAIRSGARLPLGADDQGNVILTRPMGPAATGPIGLGRRDSVLLVRAARATGRADTVAVLRARPATIKIQGPANNPTSVEVVINPLSTA